MAVLASSCCWLPLLLVSLGLSSLGVSAFFGQYRPYLLTLTFVLLGAAWLLSYRVALRQLWSRARRGTGRDESENPAGSRESCCQTHVTASLPIAFPRRSDMNRLRHLPLWLSTALVLLVASFPRWSSLVSAAGPAAATAPATEATKQVVLGIEGMTCGGCATNVEAALKKVGGVRTVTVSYEKRQTVIGVEPAVQEQALVKAVEAAGFRVVGRGNSATVEEERPTTSASLTILKASLAPLVEQFNVDKGKPRVLALLSPT
jgi:copper chaperone CopZ